MGSTICPRPESASRIGTISSIGSAPAPYDPEVIARDLHHIKDLGMNAISIFIYYDSLEAQNLLDLLRMAEDLDLKVNLSLRPGTPLDFHWNEMRALIEHYRLAQHDAIFALDLAWEPLWGNQEARRRWDADWAAWITERYGSIEAAEKDWGLPLPRDPEGHPTNPTDRQVVDDGPWRPMVAAYRRFLDTLLYEHYSRARRLVRSLDPNHHISFRMTEAGDPTFSWFGQLPYDWPYLAAAVDILEPEAYGRIGPWDRVKPGWFEFEYARWAAPELPMVWAEAGTSVWDRAQMKASGGNLEFQKDYYADFYRMLIQSGADGVFFWWYPGGFRTNEISDFGIINPDGSDRPVTKVIRAQAGRFINGPDARPIDHWLETDRDAHPAGIAGIYEATKDEFWRLIDAGRTPGLRTAATGTTSADCPLLAIGNVPCTGANPPKYLDGFFDIVEVKDARGQWVQVENNGEAPIDPSEPPLACIVLINLGEAAWLSAAPGPGSIRLLVNGAEDLETALPRNVPPRGTVTVPEVVLSDQPIQEAPLRVVLTLSCEGRTRFGPTFAFTLDPAPANSD